MSVTHDGVTVDYAVHYDHSTGSAGPGWYASYAIGGQVVDDSEKVSHPDMPVDPDAEARAVGIARAHAIRLAREAGR